MMSKHALTRWALIKQSVVFQIKLAFDAVRDLFLSPISLVFALIDILKSNPNDRTLFHQLMLFGRKTDTWINLFSQHQHQHQQEQHKSAENIPSTEGENQEKTFDQLLNNLEQAIQEQQKAGGLSLTAKDKLTSYLQKAQTMRENMNKEKQENSEN